MALKTTFGFTNNSESTKVDVKPIDLGVVSNYAVKRDDASVVVLDNKTCPLGKGELLTYRCTDIANVKTDNKIMYPLPISEGVQYTVTLDNVLTTTSDEIDGYRTDEPLVMYLTVRHTKSGNVTDDMVLQAFKRLEGALVDENGQWRFNDLMRSALKPVAD